MKIGITGGAGFIGTYVAETALLHGHSVVIFDHAGRLPQSPALNKGLDDGRVEILLGNVRDATDMTELGAHTDGIIHLAACLGTQETIKNPRPAAETNVQGGLNFLEACAQYGIPGVYIGVGNHWMENTYSISKTTIERFVRMFNAERGTAVNVVRLVNAYGPRQSVAPPFGAAKVRKITPAFVCRALTGQAIEVYGDGQQISDMVYVADGAQALVCALEVAAGNGPLDHVVECGPVRSATVNQVAQAVIDAAVSLGFPPVGITHLPMRPGEQPGARVTAQSETLRAVGMNPDALVGLKEGIHHTTRWYAENWLPTYMHNHPIPPASELALVALKEPPPISKEAELAASRQSLRETDTLVHPDGVDGCYDHQDV